LLAITLLTVDTTSSVLQKGEIAILYDRAAKAELELARMNAPRALNNKQMTDLINKLRPYAGKKYWIITQKSDETKISEPNFSAQLSTAFTTAGWVKTNRSMKDQTKEDRAESKPDDRGCSVEFDFQESSRKLGAAVLAILNDVGVKCEENPDPDILPDFIILEIGLR
jgi:hypothetical protein